MSYVAVVPYAYLQYFTDFSRSVKIPRENMLLIDNTDLNTNLGIMKSHNMGIDFMKERGADWLIVMSAAIKFGESGGLDFLEILEQHPELHVINGAGKWLHEGEDKTIALGWHLTAFRKDVFEAVGRWDENFTPYGFDDVDLTLRMRKAFGDQLKIDTFECDMRHQSTSHSIQLAGVVSPSAPRMAYFVEKWGRHPGAWQWDGWDHPFNDPAHDLKYWPRADNGGRWDE